MPYQIENRMVVDAEWEFLKKHKTRLERQREAFDEMEREGITYGKSPSSDRTASRDGKF